MFTIGGTNVARQTKMPKPPTADLIKFKPPTTDARASPSAPPIIGMKLLETNLAALIPMLSVLAAIEVCREKRPMKIVTMNIKANIVIFLTVAVIALICRLEHMPPTTEKARKAPVIGSNMFEMAAEMNCAIKKNGRTIAN